MDHLIVITWTVQMRNRVFFEYINNKEFDTYMQKE